MMSALPPSDVCHISQHVTCSTLSPALVVGLQCCLPAIGLADAHATQVAAVAAGDEEGRKVGWIQLSRLVLQQAPERCQRHAL